MVPSSKISTTLLYELDVLMVRKSKMRSSHWLATVVTTSFSKLMPPLAEFSTFSRTLAPTRGEKTFMRITLLTEKSIGLLSVIRLPPHTCPAFFTMRPTLAEVLMPPGFGLLMTVVL
ncbi:MAG: hypothetical protein EBZ67_08535, partial [Chitinophagia bacterium]|nr:hypothetical protein [Chitinophagia bacterium]